MNCTNLRAQRLKKVLFSAKQVKTRARPVPPGPQISSALIFIRPIKARPFPMHERDPLSALSLVLPGLVYLRGTCAVYLPLTDEAPPAR